MQGLIGQDVGGYRIISQIGQGGMATVFKAYQASLDRYVAVKVMPPYYAEQDDTFLKRFQQEAKAIASLRHPNILIVIDYGEENETTYIVMEFVEAGTLSEMMGKPVAPNRMTGLITQVAGALHYAHQQGVVHRDIKPSNILLPKPDWPLLTDFGLAKIVGGSQLTQSGTIAGTPAYMSPEQGRGEKVDSRSDIYSLGIVLYEMATGVVPFHAETPMAVVVKHIIDPLPLPRTKNPELPEEVERVILKSLSKDPADRFQDAEEMSKALKEAVRGLPTELAHAAPSIPIDQVTTMVDEVDVATESEKLMSRAADDQVERKAVGSAMAGISGLLSGRGRMVAAAAGVLLVAVVAIGLSQAWTGSPDDVPDGGGGQQNVSVLEEIAPEEESPPKQESSSVDNDPDLEQIPENIELFLQQAWALVEGGEYDAAAEMINIATRLGSEESWVHEEVGYLIMQIQDYGPAAEEFRQALRLDPSATWNYSNLAGALVADGQEEEAIAALFSAFENPLVTDDPFELNDLGWVFLAHDSLEGAEQAFNWSIEMEPGNPSLYEGLAEIAYRRGGPQAGLDVLEVWVQRFPEHSPFYETGGYWFWELGNLDQAIQAFDGAIELDPTNPANYGSLASLLIETGREADATELIQRALERYPNSAEALVVAADFYVGIGKVDEALALYQQSVELNPENGWMFAYYARATAETGGHDTARELLIEADAKNPGDPWLDEFIGWTYMMMNDCEHAVDHFERALAVEVIESAEQGIQECGG